MVTMTTEALSTWIAGRRSLLVEGVIVSLERSLFPVTQCFQSFSNAVESEQRPSGRLLCIQLVELQGCDIEETCLGIARMRAFCPAANIICIVDELSFDIAPLMAAGANACFRGHLTSAELNLLLALVVSGEVGLSVAVAPKSPIAKAAISTQLVQPTIAERQSEQLSNSRHFETAISQSSVSLSRREREVLAGLVNGESNKTLARGLSISEATVKAHVRTVFRKLGAHSRTQAVRYFLERCPPGASVAEWLVSHGSVGTGEGASRHDAF